MLGWEHDGGGLFGIETREQRGGGHGVQRRFFKQHGSIVGSTPRSARHTVIRMAVIWDGKRPKSHAIPPTRLESVTGPKILAPGFFLDDPEGPDPSQALSLFNNSFLEPGSHGNF